MEYAFTQAMTLWRGLHKNSDGFLTKFQNIIIWLNQIAFKTAQKYLKKLIMRRFATVFCQITKAPERKPKIIGLENFSLAFV